METLNDKVAGILGDAAQVTTGPALRRRVVADTLAKMEGGRQGFFAEIGEDIKQFGSDVSGEISDTASDLKETAADPETGIVRKAFQGIGRVAGGISKVVGAGVKGAAKVLMPGGVEETAKDAARAVGDAITSVPVVRNLIANYGSLSPAQKRDVDSLMGFSQLALDLAGFGVGRKAVSAAAPVVKETAQKAATATGEAAGRATAAFRGAVSPAPSLPKALGQVVQGRGTARELSQAAKAFAKVDLTGVKTYAELSKRMSDTVDSLKSVVDDALGKDIVPLKLGKLTTTAKAGGKSVTVNYPRLAIKQLTEMYRKTGDAQGLADINALAQQATKKGLTPLEINNLAREYGSEFGQKAFDKFGQPLTSVNAQLYENVRKGLKGVARGRITGTVAKRADEAMSAIINTNVLVQKTSQKVAQLLSKVEERGLFEKIGHYVTKYVDAVSQGFLRGVVGGALPRGVGNKVLNALDLEELLARNLKIIDRALRTADDKTLESILKGLSPLTTANK